MSSPRRSLTVEPFEDRSLPSVTFVLVSNDFAVPVHAADGFNTGPRPGPAFAEFDRPFFGGEGFASPVRGWFAERLLLRFSEFDVRGEEPGGDEATGPASPDGATAAVAAKIAAHGPAHERGDGLIGETDGLSLAVPSQPGAAAPAANRASAPPLPNSPQVASAPPIVPAAAPVFTDRVGVVSEALVVAPGDAPPATEAPAPAAPPAADSSPAAPAETLPAEETSVEVPAAVAIPVAGLVPVDLAGLGAAAGNFLGRLSALEVAWPDTMPAFEDYLWTAAATLLAAGAVHASRPGRRADPPPRGKTRLDKALAGWEGRHDV